MRAVYYEQFGGPVSIASLPDPTPAPAGVVIQVEATGLCLSDWHGWKGHDPDIRLPHVPGHELAGVVAAVGKDVTRWKPGQRVTVPFVCACGACPQCASGNQQVCDAQFQPGFTAWGSYARYVAIDRADVNLVALPASLDFATAASLGCRFATSFRAVVAQGRVSAGQWVAVHGCGGVGLSAVMIASALGANVIGIDINEEKLAFARSIGASDTLNALQVGDIPAAVRQVTGGGAHVSIDALGSSSTCFDSIACLRKRGRHIQVGLLLAEQSRPPLPMDRVVAYELEILGSHGMQAYRYDALLSMIQSGKLHPEKLIGQRIALAEAPAEFMQMDSFKRTGMTVIDRF